MDGERLSTARVVVGSSWREEMGERRADSCTEVNRRSLCILPTKKSVTNYLCLSLKRELWRHFGWVQRKDAQEAVVEEEDSEVVITGRGLENCNVL